MKRGNLLLAAASMAMSMILGCGEGTQRRLPAKVSIVEEPSDSTSSPIATLESYSTTFGATENPLSEGGKWVNGQATGLQWSNVQTGSGNAYAARLVDSAGVGRYSDPIAHLSTSYATFSANQFAEATVHKAPGYTGSGGQHEVELLLRFQITPNNARGYEVLWGISGYIAVVRWNGPNGNYTSLYELGSGFVPADGDVLRAEISGSTIRVYRNGALVTSVSDATYGSGQPGIGFWPTPGATLENYGWKSFTAGSL